MELKLLTPPTDSPFRLPLTRGLPSESSFAVDTSALPRSLPQAIVDPNMGTAPFEALARLGATGVQVSSQVSNILLEAAAKKQRASNIATSTALYTTTAEQFDKEFESIKGTATHETLRPEFDALWQRVVDPVLKGAPNADVQEHLGLALAKYRLVKSGEVSDTTRKKLQDFTEATLLTSTRDDMRRATDPDATSMEVSQAIQHMQSTFLLNAGGGIIPPDRLVTLQEKMLTGTFNELARQAMTKDPAAFMPKESDEHGNDGYKAFSNSGKYPADPKFLDSLLERAPRLQEHQANQVRLAYERRQVAQTKAMETAANSGYDNLMNDLTSGDSAKVTAASAQAVPYIQQYGSLLSHGQKQDLRDLARRPALVGGVTDDATYNALSARIHEFPGSVSEDEIRQARIDGRLQATGERSSQALIDKQRTLTKGDDVSQRPDYAVGRSLITTGLGSGITDMTASQFKALAPENIAEHNLWRSRALEEYDRKARAPEWQGKDLRDLGAQVRDAYFKIIYDRAVGEVKPPSATPKTPAASGTSPREGKAPASGGAATPAKPATGPSSWLDYILPKNPFTPPSP